MLINLPILSERSVFKEKIFVKPVACGWKKLPPILPSIINSNNNSIFGAFGVNGINTETKTNPQKTKKRFNILSAKKPNIG